MLGGDWLEQERSGDDVDRESTGDYFHATVRSQWPPPENYGNHTVQGALGHALCKHCGPTPCRSPT